MTAWQTFAVVFHSLVCVVIVVLSMDLMRKRRMHRSWRDPIIWSFYLVCVGAFAYLIEPTAGWTPTLADMFFETGVAIYLLARVLRSPNEAPQVSPA